MTHVEKYCFVAEEPFNEEFKVQSVHFPHNSGKS